MDIGLIVGIILSLVALWALLIAILWLMRPKGVPLRDVVRVIPDVVRLLRSVMSDRRAPLGARLVIGGLFVWIVSGVMEPATALVHH